MTTTHDDGPVREHSAPASATLDPVKRTDYLSLWRGVPRELLFLLPTLPIVVVAFSVLVTLFSFGVSTIIIYIGVFVAIASLRVARGFGTLELTRLRAAGRPPITPPRWQTPADGAGFWRRLVTPVTDGHYWLALLHGMVVNFAIGIATWSIAITWLAGALGGTTYWFWSRFLPHDDDELFLSRWVHDIVFPGTPMGMAPSTADALINLGFGLVFLLTLPFITRGLVSLHHAVARGMLGAWRSEALERRVVDLDESRGAAISAEGHSLRRLERDIHDGPQQRLVRLQMDLAAAERQLESDPDAVRRLLGEAREQSRDALEELRALSRGFAPPILLDRGLVAAIESLASRSPLPIVVESRLEPMTVLPQEIERNAYFVVSELVTNAVKHAEASVVRVSLAVDDEPGAGRGLRVTVADDGIGGAVPSEGHGLAGLHERVRGLGGILEVESPAGGPTLATVLLPIA